MRSDLNVNGMMYLHEGNHNEYGNPHPQYEFEGLNLIKNTDFEGDLYNYYTFGTVETSKNVVDFKETDTRTSLKVVIKNNNGGIGQVVKGLTPGQRYVASCYIFIPTGIPNANVQFNIINGDDSENEYITKNVNEREKWIYCEMEFVAKNNECQIRVGTMISTSLTDWTTLYLTNISLFKNKRKEFSKNRELYNYQIKSNDEVLEVNKSIKIGSANLGENGFCNIGNNMMLQWGSVYVASGGQTTINFPTSFTNKALNVVVTLAWGSKSNIVFATTNLSKTGFTCIPSVDGTPYSINYQVIGY